MTTINRTRSMLDIFLPMLQREEVEIQDDERRRAPRQPTALSAEVVLAGQTYRGLVINISNTGLTLRFEQMPSLFKGAQLLVRTSALEPICGSVCWIGPDTCGLAFNTAIAEDVLDDDTVLFDPGKRARPGRAKVQLAAVVRAPGLERKVTIENIGCGGALLTTGLSLPIGRGLMIEIEGIVPIGGYVRWAKLGRCGIMFSKMLTIAAAEEIREQCSIHSSWLNEIRKAHAVLAGQ